MTSCGWWENYVCIQSPISFVRSMGRIKEDLRVTRYFSHIFLSIWKVIFICCCLLIIIWIQGDDPANLFNLCTYGFGAHKIVVKETVTVLSQNLPDLVEASQVFLYVTYNLMQCISYF